MSMKIYDGLMAVDKDPFVAGDRIRQVLETEFLKSFKDFYEIVKNADPEATWESLFMFCNNYSKVGSSLLDRKLYEIIQNLHRNSQRSLSDLDIGYDVSLMKNGNDDDNPLVLVFGENSRAYSELLLESGVVVDYGYWENADYPDEVSKSEWKLREKAWECLSEKSPSEVGLNISFPSSIQSSVSLFKQGFHSKNT